jgi:adenine/guanine/hypoxanthine permease
MATFIQKAFGFDPKVSTVKKEIFAGITTFLTMSYILAVNPGIFAALPGMPAGSVFTATALAALVGTLVMAFYAKKPFALAPGMGLNAFFVFTVCLGMGYSWQFALTAVFLEGIIFVILTLTNVRKLIVDSIPASLKKAIGCGIGLFIAFIGLKNAGVVVTNASTIVSLGDITQGPALLAVIGIGITGVLVARKVPGALLVGMIVTALLGLVIKDPATGEHITKFNGIVSMPASVEPIFCQFEWSHVFSLDMFVVVFTFMFIDMFDTIGTVVGVSTKAKMVDKDGNIEGINRTLMADAIATVAGACLGTSTTTTYVESASGIAQGGRSGLTAFSAAVCFLIALFFSPLFLAIPGAATAPVLVIVGVFMMSPIKDIDFEDYSEAIPAFITLIGMPLCYSISDGIMLGVIAYVVINLLSLNFKKVSPATLILALIFIAKYLVL